MSIDSCFNLSRLRPLAERLAQGADIDSGLLDVLEEALPKKGREKLIKALDGLMQLPGGGQVLTLTLCFLLDEWLNEGNLVLLNTNQGAEPFAYLATSDHLEVVQTFRDLL